MDEYSPHDQARKPRTLLMNLFIVALVCQPCFSWAARPPAASVMSSAGKTSVIRSGRISAPLADGYALRTGDRVSTGKEGRIQLEFTDGMQMSLGPNSVFKIDDYRFTETQAKGFFELARGTLRTISGLLSRRDPAAFRLSTPTATMGIRGTEFVTTQADCRHGGCEDVAATPLRVKVIEGQVTVSTTGGMITVPAGQEAVVGLPGTMPILARSTSILSIPVKLSKKPRRQWQAQPSAPAPADTMQRIDPVDYQRR